MFVRCEYCVFFGRDLYDELITRLQEKGKGKAVPLQAWSGPEFSKEVKVPRLQDNGTGWW